MWTTAMVKAAWLSGRPVERGGKGGRHVSLGPATFGGPAVALDGPAERGQSINQSINAFISGHCEHLG